jgi:hypothetical protein
MFEGLEEDYKINGKKKKNYGCLIIILYSLILFGLGFILG